MFSESRYSRILVYSGDIDSIVGVIHQKDFYVGTGVTDKALAQIMTKPLFVANSAKISDLLKLLQRQKAHIAVVTDEYGGTLGIVTMEDILEELVGDIWDEHDEVVESIHKVGEDAYQVLGTADLEDLFEFLCIRDEETESSTVSGWVMERLGRVPRSGRASATRLAAHRGKGRPAPRLRGRGPQAARRADTRRLTTQKNDPFWVVFYVARAQ